jgi:folate-binding protein YgfZ
VRIRRDVVRVAGPDAVAFLQGQLSQDVAALAVGASAWSLVLQPQGKVDALVRLTHTEDDVVVLDLDAGFGDAVAARLDRFKLRVKADVESLGTWVGERVDCGGGQGGHGDGLVVPFVWGGVSAWDSLTAGGGAWSVEDELAYEAWRIANGVPAMGRELTEATIPEEAGVVDVAVSFTKGCYTGQELVARIDSRGRNVPRRLRRVVTDGRLDPGDELVVGGDGDKAVGVVTSATADVGGGGRSTGLAYVRRDVDVPADASLAGGRVARIEPLPPVT